MRRALAVVVLSICMLMPAAAQQPPVSDAQLQQPNPQATQLLQASLAAMGGSTLLPRASLATSDTSTHGGSSSLPGVSLVASGTSTQFTDDNGQTYALRVRMRRPDQFRWELDQPQGTTAIVINGTNAQSQSSAGSKSLVAWEFAAEKLENFPVFLIARWLATEGLDTHFVGQETVNNQTLDHISVVDPPRNLSQSLWLRDQNRGRYEVYLDPTTFLPVRLRYYQETSDTYFFSLVPIDVVYSDFKPAGPCVLPFTITRYLGEKKLATVQLKSIDLNGSVSDQDFAAR